MKPLLLLCKLCCWLFPLIVITLLSYKYDKWILMLGLVANYLGAISKRYDYKGVPILYFIGMIYLIYLGFSIFSIYTFFGFWIVWGYIFMGLSGRCLKAMEHQRKERQYQYY